MIKTRRWPFRPTHVDINDKRPPMVRLLQDCNNRQSGCIEVDYPEQWQTLNKAVRLGYVDDSLRLTDKGRGFLTKVRQ